MLNKMKSFKDKIKENAGKVDVGSVKKTVKKLFKKK